MLKYAENRKILIFHIYFMNMDISLIMRLTCLKTAIHALRINLEGIMSPNFDILLSFSLIAFRRGDNKNTKVTRFLL